LYTFDDLKYIKSDDYIGIENLVLNATFRYDLYLPDKETKRAPDDANRPITSLLEGGMRMKLPETLLISPSREFVYFFGGF